VIEEIVHIDKREVILTEAERLFAAENFDNVSVRDIARAAGVNVAMISYYFGSKEKLFEALVTKRIEASVGSLKEIAESDRTVLEKLDLVVEFYVSKFFSHRDFQRMMCREMSLSTRPDFKDFFLSKVKLNKEHTQGIIKQGMKEGVFAISDMEMVIFSIFSTLNNIIGSPHYCYKMFNLHEEQELYSRAFQQRLIHHFRAMIRIHLKH